MSTLEIGVYVQPYSVEWLNCDDKCTECYGSNGCSAGDDGRWDAIACFAWNVWQAVCLIDDEGP